jgi:hypothetical protein
MQTTLRLDDRLYRAAKAEAAREGISLTRLVEDALAQRLRQPPPAPAPHSFRIYSSGEPFALTPEELSRRIREEDEAYDLAKFRG